MNTDILGDMLAGFARMGLAGFQSGQQNLNQQKTNVRRKALPPTPPLPTGGQPPAVQMPAVQMPLSATQHGPRRRSMPGG